MAEERAEGMYVKNQKMTGLNSAGTLGTQTGASVPKEGISTVIEELKNGIPKRVVEFLSTSHVMEQPFMVAVFDHPLPSACLTIETGTDMQPVSLFSAVVFAKTVPFFIPGGISKGAIVYAPRTKGVSPRLYSTAAPAKPEALRNAGPYR